MKRGMVVVAFAVALLTSNGPVLAGQAPGGQQPEELVAPLDSVATEAPVVNIVQPQQRIAAWVRVSAAQAEIRSGPSQKYPGVDTAYQGDEFEATGRVRGWYFVRFGDDEVGWIASRAVVRLQRSQPYGQAPPQDYYAAPPSYYPSYYSSPYPYYPYAWGGGVYLYNDYYYGRPYYNYYGGHNYNNWYGSGHNNYYSNDRIIRRTPQSSPSSPPRPPRPPVRRH